MIKFDMICARRSGRLLQCLSLSKNNTDKSTWNIVKLYSTSTPSYQANKPEALKSSPGVSDGVTVSSPSNSSSFLSPESCVADASFTNRWSMVIPAVCTHICLGSPFAWSIMADAITRDRGFVAAAASDWTLSEAALPMSLVLGCFGVTASLVGKWQSKVGMRKTMVLGSAVFGTSVALGGLAIHIHSLPLLYLGYGVLGGLGIALSYTPPVQALVHWFPDRKGIASGMTIAGFGSGALLFTPMVQGLMKHFAVMPQHLGKTSDFVTKVVDGKLFAEWNGQLVEVVDAGVKELSRLPYDLSEGLYVVGTGSNGAAEALGVMSVVYFGTLLASALTIKTPHANYRAPVKSTFKAAALQSTVNPKVTSIENSPSQTPAATAQPLVDLTIDEAVRTRQFHLLGFSFFALATGGIGMMSVAKPMMSEVFSATLPHVVTSSFAANFLLMLSAGNLGGRLFWAYVSDIIGRRKTFLIFTAGAVPLYFCMPYVVSSVVSTGSVVPLYGFCAAASLAVASMGGMYAVLPAYEADLFGAKFVGGIHGRMLMWSAGAALFGPSLLLYLRSLSEKRALEELLSKISPVQFEATFGVPISQYSDLIATKTLTINKALAIAPPGTIDPSPFLYDSTMYGLGGLMTLALLSIYSVQPLTRSIQPVVTDQYASEKDKTK